MKNIVIMFLLAILGICSSCRSKKPNLVNDQKVKTGEIRINKWDYMYDLTEFNVNIDSSRNSKKSIERFAVKIDSTGVLHTQTGVRFSVDFVLNFQDYSNSHKYYNLVIDEILIVRKEKRKSLEFGKEINSDTIELIPQFKLVRIKKNQKQITEFKGQLYVWHIGSSIKNEVVIQFKDQYKTFVNQWHKSGRLE